MSQTLLIRYGLIPEVARFAANGDGPYHRGQRAVVRTHRGVEIGTVLEALRTTGEPQSNGDGESTEPQQTTLRPASPEDEDRVRQNERDCREEFFAWQQRIAGWELELELIDLEWMLEREKLVLYVLNDRGSDCTKLAIYAAAEGLGTVDVQPVNAGGLVQVEQPTGGCGSGGCGSCG